MNPGLDIDDLYRRLGPLVLRRVRRFFQDEHEARDVLQEVFLHVVTKAGSFRGESSPATWLYQITTRYCLNRLRNDARRKVLFEAQGDDLSWAPTVTRPSQEHAALVRSLWRVLDAELVEIAVYYHLDGMTHDEIAALVGCSRRTVGNRLVELEQKARASGGTT